ncbi:gliding motility-associated protein GldE [Saccharicrinis sp. FJH2]|uniref:gliding motility-associated protein GldE n=1 Tax=Saccharicrinis sp. FJH65 TaxID=3344659 RepID=UPI0035F30C4A
MEPDPFSCHSILLLTGTIHLHPLTVSAVISLLLSIVLLGMSALISGSEVAFFSLEPRDIEKLRVNDTDSKNRQILDFLKLQDRLLATILIANNFINVGIVILLSYFSNRVFDFSSAPILGFILEVVVITFLLLLFGEIMPKIYATKHGMKMARFMALPLRYTEKGFGPFVSFLVNSTNFVNKRMARKSGNISMDDLSSVLELTSEELTEDKEMLEGIIKFGNISVEEIMTSRIDMIDLDIKSNYNKVLAVIVESGFSRIPVYHNSPDKIKGILYIKDLLPHLSKNENFRWQSLIRAPYFVPETKKINDLLEEFQTNKIHMAIVIDEYGGTSGLVTLEDILEEIVGEISDEYDEDETSFTKESDGSYIFEAKTLLNDFFKITGVDESYFEDVRGEADTLAGLILEVRGEIPDKNEEISIAHCRFKILSADDRRIKKIRVYIELEEEDEKNED